MDSKQIIEAFTLLSKDKNVEKTYLASIIEDIFKSMLLKKYGDENEDIFSIIVNMDRGDIEIFHEKLVVDIVKDEVREISIEDAIKTDDTLITGDMYIDIINPDSFGRRLISHAKQHLSTRIKDIEKESIYNDFNNKIDSIYSGYVHQIQRDRIFVTDNNKIEIILPKTEQIYNDHFKRGDQIRGLIKSVDLKFGKSPEIIMSRTSNIFLQKLFELEVPEIEDGIIEIKNIARAPGDRSKIVVFSSDRRIDAVGACVGMKGSRIQSVVRELNGEKIDIINFSEQPALIISRALSPAKPIDLYIDENKKIAVAIFNDDELAMAIGRNGSNLKLTESVTGYTIEAKSESQHALSKSLKISDLSNLTDKFKKLLIDNNIKDTASFLKTEKDTLLALKGLGEKTLEKITLNIKDELRKNN
ncbi:MAG: transcription termination factor NusA [Candidatus Marinimicrobia bacterium]|nr:transcription termination factor NusA [Candidatus Neomarinimicrobiota bacterium]